MKANFIAWQIILLTLFICIAPVKTLADIPRAAVPDELQSILRDGHPRIFFSSDNLESVRARALNEEKALFAQIKNRTDKIDIDTIESADHGYRAAEAALVYLITDEQPYCELAKKLLTASIAFYHECYAQKKPVNWYAFSRINALAAYDWIFNDLNDNERKVMGKSLLDAVEQVQPTDSRHYFYPQENWSGPTTGFYGNRSLLWYVGLATYGENIDERSEYFLAEGHRLHMELLKHRRKGAGDDGGSATASLNYAMAAYPWSVFNFFHTYMSATGKNIALDWPHVSYLPGYLYWNMLPGGREFGIGDSYHRDNKISLNNMRAHITQIIHFYGDSNPDCAAFAKWMIGRVPDGNFGRFAFMPLLLTESHDDLDPVGPANTMPYARHFMNMGQTFMRSGAGPDDTYAIFMSGGVLEQHKHFDNNHFGIFRNGYLALDTGSRPPGQHTQHYYPRTIAHNCVLIHDPGEVMPIYVDKGAGGGQRWGAPAPEEQEMPVPNDGGQNELMGSEVVAFETNDDFSYVAGDATKAYSSEKCEQALRQIVFVNPDCFVIFDRIVSTKPEYSKTWLLHTATEPDIDGDIFTAAHENGRLFAKTLLPRDAGIDKIGGPGKQFRSGGHNFSMPKGHALPDTTQLLGQWRVEVETVTESQESHFLHLIQVGKENLPNMADSILIETKGTRGVRFSFGGMEHVVTFGVKGEPSGHIAITANGVTKLDRELTRNITPQNGLFGK